MEELLILSYNFGDPIKCDGWRLSGIRNRGQYQRGQCLYKWNVVFAQQHQGGTPCLTR